MAASFHQFDNPVHTGEAFVPHLISLKEKIIIENKESARWHISLLFWLCILHSGYGIKKKKEPLMLKCWPLAAIWQCLHWYSMNCEEIGAFYSPHSSPTVKIIWTWTTSTWLKAVSQHFNLPVIVSFEFQCAGEKTKQRKANKCSATLTLLHVVRRKKKEKISQHTTLAYLYALRLLPFALCWGPNKDLVWGEQWWREVMESHHSANW